MRWAEEHTHLKLMGMMIRVWQDTIFFRYWYRCLFSVPNFSGTSSGIIFGTSIFWYHFRYHPKQWKIPGESSVPVPNSREFSGTGSKFLWLSNFTGTGLYLAMFESINMDKWNYFRVLCSTSNLHDMLWMERKNRHFTAWHARCTNYAIWPNFANCAASSPVWLAVIPSHVKSLRDGLRHFDCEHSTLWAAPHLATLLNSQLHTLTKHNVWLHIGISTRQASLFHCYFIFFFFKREAVTLL